MQKSMPKSKKKSKKGKGLVGGQKPPAKRSNFDKLPLELINKISDINDPKHLPVEIVVNTVIKVTCRVRGITITHKIEVVHEDDELKSIMPSGWVETYLRQFKEWLFDEYSTTKIQSELYLDKDLGVIERYMVSLTRNVGVNFMHLPTVDADAIKRECKSIRSRLGDSVKRFNRDHEIMGMECTGDIKTWRRKMGDTLRVYEVESLYRPKKKNKVRVSKELRLNNFNFKF